MKIMRTLYAVFERDVRTVLDFCIVGPSAMGSVKGRPSSMTSLTDQQTSPVDDGGVNKPAPPASMPSRISTVSSTVGYPAVK